MTPRNWREDKSFRRLKQLVPHKEHVLYSFDRMDGGSTYATCGRVSPNKQQKDSCLNTGAQVICAPFWYMGVFEIY